MSPQIYAMQNAGICFPVQGSVRSPYPWWSLIPGDTSRPARPQTGGVQAAGRPYMEPADGHVPPLKSASALSPVPLGALGMGALGTELLAPWAPTPKGRTATLVVPGRT